MTFWPHMATGWMMLGVTQPHKGVALDPRGMRGTGLKQRIAFQEKNIFFISKDERQHMVFFFLNKGLNFNNI